MLELTEEIQSVEESQSSDTYTCHYAFCSKRRFRDKGTRDRHIREVHGSHELTCPVLSCPRSKRGFNRQYNLRDHLRRRHNRSSARLQKFPGTNDRRSTCDDSHLDTNSLRPIEEDPNDSVSSAGGEDLESEPGLEARLIYLKDMRVEIDEDISVLQRALSVVKNAY